MRPIQHVYVASTTLALLLAGACKKDEAAPTATTPPPGDKQEMKTPPPPPPGADAAAEKPKFTEVTGLQTPESVLYLADQDVYLVSNINGEPAKADDNGFISKVSPEGKITEEKWIDGSKDDVKLNAPKGSGVRGGELYVADIDTVRVFDLATGKQKKDIPIKGAAFLNDIAVDADTVYVSDTGVGADFKPTGADAIYAIDKGGKVKKLIAGADLKQPNGLLVVDGKLWVNTMGGKEIYRIDNGKKADVTELPAGMLDGFAALDDGRVAVSSWEGKAVFAGKPGDKFTAIVENVESPADITFDAKHKALLVPVMTTNTLRIYPL